MKVDMSPEAVAARLKLVSQLRRLCLSLGKARPVDQPAEPPGVEDDQYNPPTTICEPPSPSADQRASASLILQSKE